MAVVFQDTFTGADATALTARTPDVGTSWSVSGTATSAILSNANRARTSGSGAANFNVANPATALAGHAHTVRAKIRWMGSGGAGGSVIFLVSHGGGNGPTGPSWSATTGYTLRVNLETGTVGGFRNGTSLGTYPSAVPALDDGNGLAAGNEFWLYLETAESGANVTVSMRLQRVSDGLYLQSDGTWAATAADMRNEGLYSDTAPLAVAPGGMAFYEYAGNTVGIHADTFEIETPGGGAATAAPAHLRRRTRFFRGR